MAGSVDSATGCSLSALAVDDVGGVVSATADVLGSSELGGPNRSVYFRKDTNMCCSSKENVITP